MLAKTLEKDQVIFEDNILFTNVKRIIILKKGILLVGDDFSNLFPFNIVLCLLTRVSGYFHLIGHEVHV